LTAEKREKRARENVSGGWWMRAPLIFQSFNVFLKTLTFSGCLLRSGMWAMSLSVPRILRFAGALESLLGDHSAAVDNKCLEQTKDKGLSTT
jgi:hypothetical protein